MKSLSFFLASLPLLLLVSCAGESPQSTQSPATTQDTKAELCTNLARLKTSVAGFRSLSPNSTVSDLKTAKENVKMAFGNVKTSAQSVQGAKLAELEAAQQDLEKTIQGIPSTATLQQANATIAPKIAAVEAAESQLKSSLQCS